MRTALARKSRATAARVLFVLGAMLLVAAVMLGAKGPPQPSRDVRRNEIVLFAARPLLGIVQLSGEVLLLIGLTWACRGALKIRL